MADHEKRSSVGAEETDEPHLGVAVEVVRRLVQQKHVAACEKDPGQLKAPAFSSRQHSHQ